jgi:hypothetical protein
MFLCLVITLVELIRKDKERFRSARKISPNRKPTFKRSGTEHVNDFNFSSGETSSN